MTEKLVGAGKMQNDAGRPWCSRMRSGMRVELLFIAAAILGIVFSQSACLLKKGKAKVIAPSETKIVLLPFNVPPGNQDLRWIAMAGPILMGKTIERARDLKVAPLWETMPTAIDAAGVTRTFTQETAASTAAWLSANWSVMAEITPTKIGVSMMVDFIPSATGSVPFRFTKSGKIDDVGLRIPEAFSQFSYYLTIRPMEPAKKKLPAMTSLKGIAEALDREYGWFVEAEPGKAQAAVEELAESDPQLAGFLFNPSLYPTLQTK